MQYLVAVAAQELYVLLSAVMLLVNWLVVVFYHALQPFALLVLVLVASVLRTTFWEDTLTCIDAYALMGFWLGRSAL